MKNKENAEQKETYLLSDEKAMSVWNGILSAALKLPGAKISRSDFLSKELKKYYKEEDVLFAIENGFKDSVVKKSDIEKIVNSVIKSHTTMVSLISFATGLPGGWWMAGTIPADLTQFYYHVIVLAQKLAYLYGWPSFDEEAASDGFLGLLTLFIGVMSGAKGAVTAIGKISANLAGQVAKRLPQQALTKTAWYPIVKQVAKWLGVSITKQSFSKTISKVIPVLGGVISGGITVATFLPMAMRLKKYLLSLPLAENCSDEIIVEDDE